jgi:hypothetical protein
MSARAIALLACAAALAAADPWDELTAAATRPASEAQAALEALLLEHPDFHAAHYDLGTLLLSSDAQSAAAHLEAATGAADQKLAADAWHNLALARLRQGRLEDALAAATHAADLNPALGEDRDRVRAAVLVAKDAARRRAEAEARKLRLPHADLPEATVGEPYETRIAAAGGAGGYLVRTAGKSKLPEGLELDADGRLHGTPAAAGRTDLSLEVADRDGAKATGAVTLTILPPPAITTERLPEAILRQPYRAPLASVGLVRPRWSAEGLPGGLAIVAGGDGQMAIVGTPAAAGESEVIVTATDARHHVSRPLHLLVSDSFAPDASELPPATAWAEYRHRLGVRGPALEYRWELSAPAAGMGIARDGIVSGTPQAAGALAIVVTLSASDGRSREFTLALPVNPPPVIDEQGTVALTQGRPVSRPLQQHGGTPPYEWSLAEGALPDGIRLDHDGTLRGAAAASGDREVTVAVADHWHASTQKRITIHVEASKDQPRDQQQDQDQQNQAKQDQDQQNQDQQNQDKQNQDKQDQQNQAKQDQQNQDQQGQDKQGQDQQNQQNQAKQDQQNQDQQGQDKQDQDQKDQKGQQSQQGKEQRPEDATAATDRQAATRDQGARQAQRLDEAATESWLESLPAENRDALRSQLLRTAPPPRKGNPW